MSKTWFITGTSRGFGRRFAEAALERGDNVSATARNPDVLSDLVAKYGDTVLPIGLDVTDRDQVFEAVAATREKFGRLDVVVNNAGYALNGTVEEIKGDRKSLGYRRTPADHRFTQAALEVAPGTRFYMTTDGFIDQVGGERRRSFGKRRFVDLLAMNGHGSMAEEQSLLRAELLSYQGDESRRDDVSVIGMRL